MAEYKNPKFLSKSENAVYDAECAPGTAATNAGIYRCVGCGYEIGIAKGHKLPPQDHHEHTATLGAIKWQLVVFAQHKA